MSNSSRPKFKYGDRRKFIVDPTTGCWVWMGGCDGWGYGVLRAGKKIMASHKYFYEEKYGPVPKGMELGHDPDRCGNRKCCNPDHVRPIPHVVNARERVATKLDEVIVGQILDDLDHNVPVNVIELRYLVSRSTIDKIRTGQQWRDVRSTSSILNDEADETDIRGQMEEEDDDTPF